MGMLENTYDRVVVAFSGGKDSLACVLYLLDIGYTRDQIELWHHDIDGRSGQFMDWPVTDDYCKQVAQALGIRIYYSWREGGFKREMLRDNSSTGAVCYESVEGDVITLPAKPGNKNTRRKFPQVSANLSVRWCSAYLKIDVGSRIFTNDLRFRNSKTLFVTGERAEESSARAKYAEFEAHRTDKRDGKLKRHIDHWRPVLCWSEKAVWAIIEKHSIAPHPAYQLGWGRVSCLACIFGSKNQWATINKIAPSIFATIENFEHEFGTTIQRSRSIRESADAGKAYDTNPATIAQALSDTYTAPVKVASWTLPSGAYGECNGPT